MYRYETHMHTRQSSACGRSTGAEHARWYKEHGYTGIIITDHFFGGNTAAPRSGPWKERVNAFCAGYEEAKQEGDRIGLDVFFAWEETFDGDDYLVYGLDKEWLLQHPEVTSWSRADQFRAVHAAGGCVIQAHPFRCRDYIRRVHLAPDLVDGVEVANCGNDPLFDYYARIYAREYGMLMFAGSDNHLSGSPAPVYGIGTEERLTCIGDLVRMILDQKQPVLLAPEERFLPPQDLKLPLTAWMLDSGERPTRFQPDWLHE